MLASDLSTFGAPYSDQEPVIDPTTQMASEFMNRALENLAQLSRTCPRAIMKFQTRGSAGTVTIDSIRTLWGSTSSYNPTTATRNATAGEYTFTWPASFVDGLSETETLAFYAAHAQIEDATAADTGFIKCVATGTTVNLYMYSTAGAASDLTAGTVIVLWVY